MAKSASKQIRRPSRKSLANLEPPPRAKRPEALTSREQQLLEHIWAGFKNKEIGLRLKISVKTVEVHRVNIKEKLNTPTATELIRFAVRWIESGDRPGE